MRSRSALGRLSGPVRGDGGTTAVVTAVVAVLLFSVAALAVDLASAYTRDATTRTAADEAAVAAAGRLPDRCAARDTAVAVLLADANRVGDDDAAGGLLAVDVGALTDGDPANGEVSAVDEDGATVTLGGLAGDDCIGTEGRIRVTTPPATVDFGLARLLGAESAEVSTTAAAEVRSPLPVLPLAVPDECAAPGPRTYALRPPDAAPVVEPLPPGHVFDPAAASPSPYALQRVELGPVAGEVTVEVAGPADTLYWQAELTAVVDGAVVRLLGSPQLLTGFPDAAGQSSAIPLPEDVAPGTWAVRVGWSRVADGPYDVTETMLDLTVPGTSSPVPGACDGSGGFGDVLLLVSGEAGADPAAVVADGFDDPPRTDDAQPATVAGVGTQRAAADDVTAGAVARLVLADDPECGDRREVTLVSGDTVSVNHLSCYAAAADTSGTPTTWSFGDPTVMSDPRAVLVPVVDLAADPLVTDPARPESDTPAAVTGYRLGVLTDETPDSVAAGTGPPGCTSTSCDALTLTATGELATLSVVLADPSALPGTTVELRDNGRVWVAGPYDVHLVE